VQGIRHRLIVKARAGLTSKPSPLGQAIGAGAAMSPGSQMRALTANRARPNSTTIAAGNRVERKNCKGLGTQKSHSGGRAVGWGTAASEQLDGSSS